MRVARRLPLFIVVLALFGATSWYFEPAWQSEARTPLVPPPLSVTSVSKSGESFTAIVPLEPIPGLLPERVALGERLFHDARLSADFSLACASCHLLHKGGVDGRRFSIGIKGAVGRVNAPSVLNSGYNMAQFWDGRAASLEEQVAGPIHNPIEMGSSWQQVISRLEQDDIFKARFLRAYPDGLKPENIVNAIASFERSLVTVNGRFDRYLKGEVQALSTLEISGYRRFSEYGCTRCHHGALLGGNSYQKFDILGDFFVSRPSTKEDLGRFNVTGREEDRHVFKVPGLRNVARTAPYFHDGSAETLEQAVMVMGRYQLGRDLSAGDVEAIVAFLKTLDGEVPKKGGS